MRFVKRQDPEKWQTIFLQLMTGVFITAFFLGVFVFYIVGGGVKLLLVLAIMGACTIAISPAVRPGAYVQMFIMVVELCCLQVLGTAWAIGLSAS